MGKHNFVNVAAPLLQLKMKIFSLHIRVRSDGKMSCLYCIHVLVWVCLMVGWLVGLSAGLRKNVRVNFQ